MKRISYNLLLSGVAFLYGYAGATKIVQLQNLADAIDGYALPLAGWMVVAIAFLLPPMEILSAIAVFWAKIRCAALLLLGILTGVFFCALIQAKIRGLDIDCGCFGNLLPGDNNVTIAIIRDILLLAAIAFLYWREVMCDNRPIAK